MNCKPGDLAIVIRSVKGFEDCIGRIVNVVRWNEHRQLWEIEFIGTAPISIIGYKKVLGSDTSLRPISGLPDTEDTDIEQPISEVA